MKIGFENVMLSDETGEVAAHIEICYIAKKLVKKIGHCVKIIVSMSQKQHQQLMSILIFCHEVEKTQKDHVKNNKTTKKGKNKIKKKRKSKNSKANKLNGQKYKNKTKEKRNKK